MKVELIKRKGQKHSVTVNIDTSAQIARKGRIVHIGGYIAEHKTEEDAARLYSTLITAIIRKKGSQKIYDTDRTIKVDKTGKEL